MVKDVTPNWSSSPKNHPAPTSKKGTDERIQKMGNRNLHRYTKDRQEPTSAAQQLSTPNLLRMTLCQSDLALTSNTFLNKREIHKGSDA